MTNGWNKLLLYTKHYELCRQTITTCGRGHRSVFVCYSLTRGNPILLLCPFVTVSKALTSLKWKTRIFFSLSLQDSCLEPLHAHELEASIYLEAHRHREFFIDIHISRDTEPNIQGHYFYFEVKFTATPSYIGFLLAQSINACAEIFGYCGTIVKKCIIIYV